MKTQLNRLLNLVLYLACCACVGTGFLLAFRLPPGSRGGHGLQVWGLDRHEWGDIHFVLALIIVVLTAVHLALHGRWLIRVAARNHPWRLVTGLGIGLLMVGLSMLVPVESSTGWRF